MAEVQRGVNKVEALQAAWSTRTLWWVYASILILASITSLEGQVTYIFTPYITSDFSAHAMLSTIQIISAVLQTVLKAPAAKIADVFGRTEAIVVGIVFYILGYVCMAVSSSIWWYAASQILYIGGNTSIQFLIQLIVADTSSLVNRALFSAAVAAPFLWTVWAGPPLGQWLLDKVGWRWGVGLWAFIIPFAAAPLLTVLIIHQMKVKPADPALQDNLIADSESRSVVETPRKAAWWRRILHYMNELDVVGTLIVSAALALTLVPLTLASNSSENWKSASVIASICCGVVTFVFFVLYELYLAPMPFVSLRLFKSPSIFFACFAGFFYFFAFYVGRLYFPSYLQVAAFENPSDAGLINNGVNFASTSCGILTGVAIKYTKTIRPYLYAASVLYIIGTVMPVFWPQPANAITGLVFAQIIMGLGGGLFATPNQTMVQAHVVHQDLSAATALVLIITTLGWSTGAAVAGAVWTNELPKQLSDRLPSGSEDLVDSIARDINVAMSYPAGSAVRNAINDAYYQVTRLLCLIALGLGVLMFACVCGIRRAPNTLKTEPPVETPPIDDDESAAL